MAPFRVVRRVGAVVFILALGLALSWRAARAGLDQWTSGGPEGAGFILALAVDPNAPDTLFAGTDGGGAYRTTNAGLTWTPVGPPGMTTTRAVAVDPGSSANVYAGVHQFVYRSTDGGLTWPYSAMLAAPGPVSTSEAIVIDPDTPSTLYVATTNSVFKSTNSGTTWVASSSGMTSTSTRDLALDPTDPTILYAATAAGVFKSTNAAATWAPTGLGTFVWSVGVDPGNPMHIVAGVPGGALQSFDGGASWVTFTAGLGAIDVFRLRFDAAGALYAGANPGVFRTAAPFASWTAVGGVPAGLFRALAPHPTDASKLHAGHSSRGVLATADGGATWEFRNAGLRNTFIQAIAVEQSSGAVFAGGVFGSQEIGVYRSVDHGVTWTRVNTGLGSFQIRALAVDQQTPGTVFAGTLFNGVFRSTNSGGNWSAVNTGLTNMQIRALAVHPADSTVVLAGTQGGGVFRSLTGGASWAASNAGLPAGTVANALAFAETDPGTVFLATQAGGVFRSTDAGASWSAINAGLPGLNILTVATDPQVAGLVYASVSGSAGLYRSTDSGASWASAGLSFVEAVAPLPTAYPSPVFASQGAVGVRRSVTGSSPWTLPGGGLTQHTVLSLAVDRARAIVYAGTRGGGVHAFTEGYTLTVSVTGGGQVTSDPAGVSCPGDCSETFLVHTMVELAPVANPGFAFAGWSGACGGTGTCEVSMSQARAVTATFVAADTTPPDVAVTQAPPPVLGWNTTDVEVTINATDAGSGVDTISCLLTGATSGAVSGAQGAASLIIPVTAEGTTNGSCVATDVSGNASAAHGFTVAIDRTPPAIDLFSPAAATYDLHEVVTASFACSDALSGVATCSGTVPSGAPIDTSTAGSRTFEVSSTDVAGRTAAASVTYTVRKGTPAIAWPDPAPITFGTAIGPAQLNATASVAGAFVYTPAAGTVLLAGSHTLSVAFTPADPNYEPVAASVTLVVIGYEFMGFEAPLIRDGSASIRQNNGGRTIPVKFQLRLDGQVTGAATATIAVYRILDVASGTVDTTNLTTDAGASNDNGTLFRYDAADQRYIYNLSTAGWQAPATYQVVVTLNDGSVHRVNFSLR